MIEANLMDGDYDEDATTTKTIQVWEGSQKNLFQKYKSKCNAVIQQIEGNLNTLKETYNL